MCRAYAPWMWCGAVLLLVVGSSPCQAQCESGPRLVVVPPYTSVDAIHLGDTADFRWAPCANPVPDAQIWESTFTTSAPCVGLTRLHVQVAGVEVDTNKVHLDGALIGYLPVGSPTPSCDFETEVFAIPPLSPGTHTLRITTSYKPRVGIELDDFVFHDVYFDTPALEGEVCPSDTEVCLPVAELVVPLIVSGVMHPLSAIGLDLLFDPTYLTFVRVDPGPLVDGWDLFSANVLGGDRVRIGAITIPPSPAADPDTLAFVIFDVVGGATGSTVLTTTNFVNDFSGFPDCMGMVAFQSGETPFGPQDYLRDRGQPVTVTDTFTVSGSADSCLLVITNGGSGGQYSRVSSAVVILNGEEVVSPDDFNQQVEEITVPVELENENTISVEVRSGPESGFTLEIVCQCVSDGCPHNGDINGDGSLTPLDADCAMEYALSGTMPPHCDFGTGCEEAAADVNCDGVCTLADADWIFERIPCFGDPLECGGRLPPCTISGDDVGTAVPEALQSAGFGRPVPNPFRESTRLLLSVADPGGANVRVSVYDVTGRLVRTIAAGQRPAGDHVVTWDGRNEANQRVAEGAYFVRLEVGSQTQTRKVVYLRED